MLLLHFHQLYVLFLVRVPEYTTQKYASFACGLFWARGYWEPADTGKALKAEHKFPFCKGNLHLCKRWHPLHSELFLSGEGTQSAEQIRLNSLATTLSRVSVPLLAFPSQKPQGPFAYFSQGWATSPSSRPSELLTAGYAHVYARCTLMTHLVWLTGPSWDLGSPLKSLPLPYTVVRTSTSLRQHASSDPLTLIRQRKGNLYYFGGGGFIFNLSFFFSSFLKKFIFIGVQLL